MSYRLTAPPDESIAWCIQLYKSRPQACLSYLRVAYPKSRIVLLVDGDWENLAEYERIGRQFDAQVVAGEHLMEASKSHLYVERLLRHGLDGAERFFFRIDPDTRIWRRFAWLPNIPCAFGTLETVTESLKDRIRHPPNIQGGCIGMTREVIEGVLSSGVLNYEQCVTHASRGWVRNKDCEHVTSRGLMLDDFLISWAVDAAGFPIIQHPEIASYWDGPMPNTNLAFAVTHPHKEMEDSGEVAISDRPEPSKAVPTGTGGPTRPHSIALLTSDDISISVPATLRCVSTYVLLEQEQWFERELGFLARWLSEGMNAIDIGANVGVYSLPIARAVGPSGAVFAFEPDREIASHLEASRELNRLNNLVISATAISDSARNAWLKIANSREYNSLVEHAGDSPGMQQVSVSTLDIEELASQWPTIDFVKIDAEGSEAKIVAGGQRFLSSQSPLVMYEIKHGDAASQTARRSLEALGYSTFRVLGDGSCLVPVAIDEKLDSFELNLFAAKPDRSASLAAAGLLVDQAEANHELSTVEQTLALQKMLDLPYARAFGISMDDVLHCPFGEALVAYAAYRFGGLSANRRHAALRHAFETIKDASRLSSTPAALATLVRIALDLGSRGEAFETLSALVTNVNAEIDQPFFPPCERYESLSSEGRESDWFVAAVNEQFELSRGYSSKVLGDRDRMKWLCEGPFSSPAISRRVILRSILLGGGVAGLSGFLNPRHSHKNRSLWTPGGLPDLIALRESNPRY